VCYDGVLHYVIPVLWWGAKLILCEGFSNIGRSCDRGWDGEAGKLCDSATLNDCGSNTEIHFNTDRLYNPATLNDYGSDTFLNWKILWLSDTEQLREWCIFILEDCVTQWHWTTAWVMHFCTGRLCDSATLNDCGSDTFLSWKIVWPSNTERLREWWISKPEDCVTQQHWTTAGVMNF